MSLLTDKSTRRARELYDHNAFIKKNFLISEEAYFGKDNVFVTTLVSLLDDLKAGYSNALDIRKQSEKLQAMKPVIQSIENHLATSLNVDRVSISLFDDLNAFCIPMCWDTALIAGKRKAVDLEDIVETSHGYRFKSPTGKTLIFGLGLGLIRKDFTSREIAAVMMHEVGHALQHMLYGINNNLKYTTVKFLSGMISKILNALNLDVDPSFFYNLVDVLVIREDDRDAKVGFMEKLMILMATDLQSRDSIGDKLESGSDRVIKKIGEKPGIFTKILMWLANAIAWIFSAVFSILAYPFAALIMILISASVRTHGVDEYYSDGYLTRNKKWEQFADHITSSYGLGVEQASALGKLNLSRYYDRKKSALNLLPNMLMATPACRLGMAAADFQALTIGALEAGYDNSKGRISNLYKTLKFELENNKDLTAKERLEIGNQIDGIKSQFDELFSEANPDPMYSIIKDFINTSIENEKTSIEVNVLKVVKNNKENFKAVIAKNMDVKAAPKRTPFQNVQGLLNFAKNMSKDKEVAGFQKNMAAAATRELPAITV